MTVEDLLEMLKPLPPQAQVVFRHDRDDLPDDYEAVDVFYDRGEVFIDIHSGDEDDEEED